MVKLKEQLESFVQTNPTNVKRNGDSYDKTHKFVTRVVKFSVFAYRRLQSLDMTARLLRDLMDWALRRYHEYCILQNFGAHYREVGIKTKKGNVFEHVFPARLARDLLIHGIFDTEQAMNVPTCLLSKKNDVILNKKFSKSTPDMYYVFRRYEQAIPGIKIETVHGQPVDLHNWTMEDHFKLFNIKC
jgi:hypothetical protein